MEGRGNSPISQADPVAGADLADCPWEIDRSDQRRPVKFDRDFGFAEYLERVPMRWSDMGGIFFRKILRKSDSFVRRS